MYLRLTSCISLTIGDRRPRLAYGTGRYFGFAFVLSHSILTDRFRAGSVGLLSKSESESETTEPQRGTHTRYILDQLIENEPVRLCLLPNLRKFRRGKQSEREWIIS